MNFDEKTENSCFAYCLADAWGCPVSSIFVTTDTKDNVICRLHHRRVLTVPDEECVTVPKETVEKILSIIKGKPDIFNVKGFASPNAIILDGTISKFYFSDYEKNIRLTDYNTWYWLENKPGDNDTSLILNTFIEIRDILVASGIGEEYFQLNY